MILNVLAEKIVRSIINGAIKVGKALEADNALTLDGHGAEYFALLEGTVKRINLKGQLQTVDYRKSVIALCKTSATRTAFNSATNGTITIHRSSSHSLSSEARINVLMANEYIADYNVMCALETLSGGDTIKPCVFTYNGETYGGIEIYMSASYSNDIEFYGVTNFDIFALDYFDTKNNVALNEEVANSINYEIYKYIPYYFNNKKVATEEDFANYLPLTGGTITGNLLLEKTTAEVASILAGNVNGEVSLRVDANGTRGLFDNTISDYLIYNDGTNKVFKGTASGNLPLDGGTIENIFLSPLTINRSNTSANQVALCFKLAGTSLAHIGAKANGDLYALDGSGADVGKLLHTGNSAKVVIDDIAPSDTTALWIDTSA